MDNKFNFTKEAIEKLPRPEKKTNTYKDTKEHGLILVVYPSGNKYFYIAKNISKGTGKKKKYHRKRIGLFPDLSISDARARVVELKGKIALGHNPFEKEPESHKEMTFKELLDIYITDYAMHKVKRWKYIINDMERQAKSFYDMGISTI
jgi:hypothetical protein